MGLQAGTAYNLQLKEKKKKRKTRTHDKLTLKNTCKNQRLLSVRCISKCERGLACFCVSLKSLAAAETSTRERRKKEKQQIGFTFEVFFNESIISPLICKDFLFLYPPKHVILYVPVPASGLLPFKNVLPVLSVSKAHISVLHYSPCDVLKHFLLPCITNSNTDAE